MDDAFKIYVEQLRDGQVEEIHEKLDPAFLDIHEEALRFKEPVLVDGQAYLAEDELILNLTIAVSAEMPCVVCNKPTKVDIKVKDFYFAEPLDEIKSGVFNFKELLRETILLETPQFAECSQGECPSRKEIAKYLKPPASAEGSQPEEDEGYHPFADFDWDKTKKS